MANDNFLSFRFNFCAGQMKCGRGEIFSGALRIDAIAKSQINDIKTFPPFAYIMILNRRRNS